MSSCFLCSISEAVRDIVIALLGDVAVDAVVDVAGMAGAELLATTGTAGEAAVTPLLMAAVL